jgi:DNA-binding NarL/FixJ family response regulator
MRILKIMVIDNHVIFREGLIRLLEDQEDMQVVGEADNILEAIEKSAELMPDVIVTEIGPSDEAAMDAIKAIRSNDNQVAIVILTSIQSDELMFTAFGYGVRGYLQKNTSLTHLLASLRAIGRGEAAIPRHLFTRFLEEFSRTRKQYTNQNAELDTLTLRELEILSHLSTGATNREIAQKVSISENTVRVHVHNILEKLQLQNRREAREFARRIGFP